MQAAPFEEVSSENFGVFRARRRVFNPYSYVGGIVTSRIGAGGEYNTAYGLDGIMRLFGDDYLDIKWAQTLRAAGHEVPCVLMTRGIYPKSSRPRNQVTSSHSSKSRSGSPACWKSSSRSPKERKRDVSAPLSREHRISKTVPTLWLLAARSTRICPTKCTRQLEDSRLDLAMQAVIIYAHVDETIRRFTRCHPAFGPHLGARCELASMARPGPQRRIEGFRATARMGRAHSLENTRRRSWALFPDCLGRPDVRNDRRRR